MAYDGGVITRKDIIEDEALRFGVEYAKNVEIAISKNKELVNSLNSIESLAKQIRNAKTNTEYISIKKDAIENLKELNRLSNEQYNAEIKLEKIKQERLKTERESIRNNQQIYNNKKKNVDISIRERIEQQLKNKVDKEAILTEMGLIGAYQKLNAQRTESKKRLQDLIATGNASNKQLRQAQKEFDVLDKKVRKADDATRDFTKNVGNYKSAFNGLSNLMGAFGIIGGITGAVALGKSIYETTKQIQAQEIALKMLSETEETYIKNKDFLIRISEQYGLELMTTTNAYKNYFASAKTSIEEGKISFNEMQMIFEKVSKSSSMLGLSVEQQEGAFLAISQMMSKGTVQSEELRGQLGERLPGAFEVMAKSLNVTTAELGDMLKKGEVMSADVLPKFAIAYEKAIGANQISRVETLAAAQNRASNKWTEFVENLNKGKGTISQIGLGFFNMTSNILDLIGAKEKLSKTIKSEQIELNLLIGKITTLNISNEERSQLIDKLKTSYPDFISFITNEDYSNQNLIQTLKVVNENYRERIALQIQMEKENDLLEERDKIARMSIIAENNLFEKLHELNVKYNLGLHITKDNLQESANQLQQVGKQNLSVWETTTVEYYQHTLARLLPTLENVNKKYDDLIQKNKKIQFSTLEKIPESRRQYLEDKWDKEQEEKRNANTKIGNSTSLENSDKKTKGKTKEQIEKDALKQRKEIYEKQIDLEIWKKTRESELYEEASKDEKLTMDERLDAFEKSNQAKEDALKLSLEKEFTLASNFIYGKKDLTKQEIQLYADLNSNIDSLTNEQKLIVEKYRAEMQKLDKDAIKSKEEIVKKEAELIAKQTAGVLLGVDKNKFDDLKALEESYQKKEITIEQYEKKLAEISLKYTTKTFEEQIKGLSKLVDLTAYNEDEKLKIKVQIAEAEMNLIKAKNDYERDQSEKTTEAYKKKLDIVRQSVAEFSNLFAETFNIDGQIVENFIMNLLDKTATIEEKIKATVQMIAAMTDAVYQQRIDSIDTEIEKTNEKYEREINLANGNEKAQERLRIKQQADVEKLEAKKKREQQKQANAQKAFAIAQTIWATAQAIMQAYAQLGPIGGTIAAVLVGTLGAIQINQIRKQEIPKYEYGTRGKGHKGGLAEVAEKRPEVIKEPGKDPYIVSQRSILDLPKDTEVIPSVDEYIRLQRTASMMSLVSEKEKFDNYEATMMLDSLYGAEMLKELKELRKQKQNINVHTSTNFDFGHELWRLKNIKWN